MLGGDGAIVLSGAGRIRAAVRAFELRRCAAVSGSVERAAVLTLGTGVGCGLFLGGDAPLRDVEAGHASVGGPDGRPCPCGARGCLEAYAAAPAIVKAYGDEAVTCGDPCGNQFSTNAP